MANYDSSQVGVPYIRGNNISISYSTKGIPTVAVSQALAIKLADGSVRELEAVDSITFVLDMVNDANTPIPLVDPTTGATLGPTTTLTQVMLCVLAVIRQQQLIKNP